MRRPALFLTVAVASGVLASTASAQSLSERIQGVMQQRAAQQEAQFASRGSMLRALLRTGITVNFDQTPAKDAFAYVKRVLGVDIVYRWSTDPGATSGLDPEAPITLNATGAPALAVIERMLEQATNEPATWQLRDGYVEVGTKSRLNARNAQETRIYPIRDLLFEPPMFDNAPDFNLGDAISQGGQSGGGGGGGGNGGGFGGGGGGGGFGGGGSGGGGGGGPPIGDPGDPPPRRPAEERAQELIDLITNTVEPDAWIDPTVATIRYYDGMLIVRAPDYVQRQLGGYGPTLAAEASQPRGGRYVSLTAPIGVAQNVKFNTTTVTGAAGGGGGTFAPNGGTTNGTGTGTKDSQPAKGTDSKDSKGTKQSKDSKESKDSKDSKDSKGTTGTGGSAGGSGSTGTTTGK